MRPPLYIVTDTSGSTVREGFNEGWNQAVPRLIDAIEEVAGGDCRVCLISYGTEAIVRVPLSCVQDVTMIPSMPAAGLSSVAAGLRLLARTIREDHRQLASDEVPVTGAVALAVMYDLGTDPDEQILSAAGDVRASGAIALHAAFPAADGRLGFAGLGATAHPIAVGDAQRVAASITAAVRAVLDG